MLPITSMIVLQEIWESVVGPTNPSLSGMMAEWLETEKAVLL